MSDITIARTIPMLRHLGCDTAHSIRDHSIAIAHPSGETRIENLVDGAVRLIGRIAVDDENRPTVTPCIDNTVDELVGLLAEAADMTYGTRESVGKQYEIWVWVDEGQAADNVDTSLAAELREFGAEMASFSGDATGRYAPSALAHRLLTMVADR
ncbi:hypothetical protein IU501_10800 [Nocardia otitidiscaviarum]|uniref:hypothetical protein n=1 Tax=Nocardia otitidiscaviarum TaxID=1823 RepID=UPI0018933AA7|nr:hypothetical protein [Nocardia otitidiscaviarum]MBF6133487.1 hypothetical protein [Nocardia otitidiscaviarum]